MPAGFIDTVTESEGGADPAVSDNDTQGRDFDAVHVIVPPPVLPTPTVTFRGAVVPTFAES